MVSRELKIPEAELSRRLQKLMFLRVLFVSLLLGASVFIQVKETNTYFGEIQTSHYLVISTIYFLTFIYVILLKYGRYLTQIAYIQLLADTFLVTVIVYTTGGIESSFSFLYILTIINGSIILYRKGGMITASSSSILYGLLLDLHYYGIIHPFGGPPNYPVDYQSPYIFYMIVVNVSAFYLVAFLSSYPSEQARRSRVELRAKQDDITKLEALNERIIQSMASGLITLDSEKDVILFNPAAEEIFGLSTGAAIGQKITTILPFLENYLDKETEDSGPIMKKRPSFIDVTYHGKNRQEKFLRFSISPLELSGAGQVGYILFFQDVTEIKNIEEEMKRVEGLALIGELAAGIAHEIRNPMASISGSIQILKEGMDQDVVNNRLMDIILREITRLNNLVNDFLIFAKPFKASFQDFDLHKLIMESLELFRNMGHWTDKIRVETHWGGEIRLESDPEQLKQVLWNLFLNASEAMPYGGSLHIRTEVLNGRGDPPKSNKMVRITVRDTGQGFSPKAISQLFTPFFTTKEGGSGLGLATVKRIVEGLKGKVYGKNHPEGGAEVTIVLRSSPFPIP